MATSIICVGNATLDRIWNVPHLPVPGEKLRSVGYLEVKNDFHCCDRIALFNHNSGGTFQHLSEFAHARILQGDTCQTIFDNAIFALRRAKLGTHFIKLNSLERFE